MGVTLEARDLAIGCPGRPAGAGIGLAAGQGAVLWLLGPSAVAGARAASAWPPSLRQPLLRRPAEIPLMVSSSAARAASSPGRSRRALRSSTWRWFSGSM